MKALKEKRVSLRSLFRRSLVILSLLALAFAVASCSSDSGGSEGPSGPTGSTDPTGPEPTGKYVKDLVVLKHPNMYSFEGAAPNLSGLQVAVYWSDNTMTIDEPASSFYILPPVAKLPGRDGTGTMSSCTAVSDFGAYYLYYDGASAAKPANIYIPAVVALAWDGTASTLTGTNTTNEPKISMSGKIPAVYEDQLPFDASKVTMKAYYTALPASSIDPDHDGSYMGVTTGLPNDYGYPGLKWDAVTAGEKEVPVTSHPTAWDVKRATTSTADIDSKLAYIPVLEFDTVSFDADVGAFYYVDKLEYISGSAKLRPFLADEEELTGKDINWVQELTDAKARFNVIYYTGPNQELSSYKREIGMDDYVKAMYTVGKDGNAKATVPIVSGETGIYNNKQSTSMIQKSVIGDWEAVISCFYYQPGIEGTYGKGKFNGTAGSDGAVSARPWANAAIIPLTADGKVYIFDRIEMDRKKNTKENGEPEVLLGGVAGTRRTTMKDLVVSTQTYYEIYYVYVDPNDPSKEIKSNDKDTLGWSYTVPWGVDDTPFATSTGSIASATLGAPEVPDSDGKLAVAEWFKGWVQLYNSTTNSPIDYTLEPGEQGEFDVRVRYPRSDDGNDDVTFVYNVLP